MYGFRGEVAICDDGEHIVALWSRSGAEGILGHELKTRQGLSEERKKEFKAKLDASLREAPVLEFHHRAKLIKRICVSERDIPFEAIKFTYSHTHSGPTRRVGQGHETCVEEI